MEGTVKDLKMYLDKLPDNMKVKILSACMGYDAVADYKGLDIENSEHISIMDSALHIGEII